MWYIYKIREISEARFAVRANSEKEAEKKVYAWEEEHHEEVREYLNEACMNDDSIEIILPDKEALNNYPGIVNFVVGDSPLREEHNRSLHIRFTDGSNPVVCYNKTIPELARKIAEWGSEYILVPDPDLPGCIDKQCVYLLGEKRTQGRYPWESTTKRP